MGIDEWTEGVGEHRSGGQCVIYPGAKTNRCNPRGDFVSSGLGKNLEVRPS